MHSKVLKKTGMDLNFVRSMCMPVETGLPVVGQRIMSSPIALSHSTAGKVNGRGKVRVKPRISDAGLRCAPQKIVLRRTIACVIVIRRGVHVSLAASTILSASMSPYRRRR
jgi:hypothetical protein